MAESTVVLYAAELQHMDLRILEHVISTCINGANAFPTLAEIRRDYAAAYQREQEANRKPMLNMGGSPMPESVKAQVEELHRKTAARAAELDRDAP